jgi:thiamine-monophosphate kinase
VTDPLAEVRPPAPTVSASSERELIARIQCRLAPAPEWLLVGIGDDAAVVEPERNRVDVLTVDALVEGVHFDRAFVPPDAIGYRALAVNLSDLAAMGAAPRLALVSMMLPRTLPLADFDGIADGLARLAARHRVHVVGGNITRSPGPLVLDVTASGTVKRRQALRRSGARPGDDVYVSGTIGAAGAGLAYLRSTTAKLTVDDAGHGAGSVPSAAALFVRRYLYPEPRVRLGVLLARNRAASAAMDLSDGLADAVRQVSEASGVGMIIEEDALPVPEDARRLLGGEDPIGSAVAAGDDYELLFTARRRAGGRVTAATRHAQVDVRRIGVCTDRPGELLLKRGNATRPVPQPAFHHFQ